KNELAAAVDAYNKALAIDPQVGAAWDGLGTTLLFRRDHAGAVAAHRKAVALDPTQPLFHRNLGMSLSASRDYEGAVRSYQNAIDNDPKDPKAHVFLGGVLLKQGRFGEARETFRLASNLVPPADPFHQMSIAQVQVCDRLMALDWKLP